jgi:hypothetical protein
LIKKICFWLFKMLKKTDPHGLWARWAILPIPKVPKIREIP